MRPSGENWTTVGFVSPLSATVSWKPLGNTDPSAVRPGPAAGRTTPSAVKTNAARTAATARRTVCTRSNTRDPHFAIRAGGKAPHYRPNLASYRTGSKPTDVRTNRFMGVNREEAADRHGRAGPDRPG